MNEISNESINLKINKFLKDPKIVKPYLINSIRTDKFTNYFPQIILNNNPLVKAKIQKIKGYFPKLYFYESNDLFRNKRLIFLQFFIPYLENSEKRIFLSIIQNIFKDNIISFKRFSWDGFLDTFSRIDFYDFYKRDFFYNKDLFAQYFTYVNNILRKDLKAFDKEFSNNLELVPLNNNFQSLIQKVRSRTNSRIKNYEVEDLQKLVNFHQNLEKYLINKKRLDVIKKENIFRNYIKSILLYPAFQYFGLEQYYLYITPIDFKDIDFKLLLMNTFQKIEYLASIQETNSLLIKSIFPYKEPNCSYLNWLRSKNKIIEYCLFSVLSFNQILHFKNNLHLNDWSIDPNNFKIYTQKIISDSNYRVQEPKIKRFKTSNLSISKYYDPKSSYFKDLTDLYNRQTINIKRNLNLSNDSILEKIRSLMKKKMVFPYIRLKNLDLKEKIHIMLFNLKGDSIETLKKIFQYFNLVYLFEIEGEYYIHGFDEPKKIRNGLMIKLYLPDCELAEILRILEYVFQYLEVEKYLIIPDLVDGESFLKTVYGDISFLEDYNPLNNLIWNERTQTWKNHTLFTQNFEYLYPDLDYQQDNQ